MVKDALLISGTTWRMRWVNIRHTIFRGRNGDRSHQGGQEAQEKQMQLHCERPHEARWERSKEMCVSKKVDGK